MRVDSAPFFFVVLQRPFVNLLLSLDRVNLDHIVFPYYAESARLVMQACLLEGTFALIPAPHYLIPLAGLLHEE